MHELEHAPLGRPVAYVSEYDPRLLFPIARAPQREALGIGTPLPFHGVDLWTAYELSWLAPSGKPQVALARIAVPASSPCIVESKSLKLYLNSFNQTRLDGPAELRVRLERDLGAGFGAPVAVELVGPERFADERLAELDGDCLDGLDIATDTYTPEPGFLTAAAGVAPVREVLVSHLLKSNCRVTGQPDWASVQIAYAGPPIDHAGLLRYLISFRNHNEFHEPCVERIFVDVLRRCAPAQLSVYARYTRRGGLDINPFRSTDAGAQPPRVRCARQ